MLHADNKASEQFIHIWQEAFGDTEEEIRGFFKACEGRERILTWEEGGETAGQCVLIPATFLGKRIWYIYAVATAMPFRRQGVCTKLLCAVRNLLAREGSGAVLVPADDALAQFYEKRGFFSLFLGEKTVVTEDKNTVSKGHDKNVIPRVDMVDIDIETYLNIRKKEFSLSCVIDLPKSLLVYAVRQHVAGGSELKKLLWNEKEYGILYEKQGSGILVREITAADGEEARQAVLAFLLNMGEKTAWLQRSYPTYAIGMDRYTLRYPRQQGYFNLVLD